MHSQTFSNGSYPAVYDRHLRRQRIITCTQRVRRGGSRPSKKEGVRTAFRGKTRPFPNALLSIVYLCALRSIVIFTLIHTKNYKIGAPLATLRYAYSNFYCIVVQPKYSTLLIDNDLRCVKCKLSLFVNTAAAVGLFTLSYSRSFRKYKLYNDVYVTDTVSISKPRCIVSYRPICVHQNIIYSEFSMQRFQCIYSTKHNNISSECSK